MKLFYRFFFLTNVILASFTMQATAQTVIWQEDFDGYSDLIFVGTGQGDPPNDNVGWEGVDVDLTVWEDYIWGWVKKGDITTWTTEGIDISNFSEIRLSADVWSEASKSNSYIRFMYSYNNAHFTELQRYYGSFSKTSFDLSIPDGNLLYLKVELYTTHKKYEDFYFDNIRLEGASLSLTLDSKSDVTCPSGNDGAITVSAAGGNGSYSYSWDSGHSGASISGLTAGDYLVTVTSGSDTQSLSVTINEPASLMPVVPTVTDILCNGDANGSITLNLPVPIEFNDSPSINHRDYIDTQSGLLNSLSAFTMEGWIRFDKADLSGKTRVGLFGQNDLVEFGFPDENTLGLWTEDDGLFQVPLSVYPDDNNYHHVAVTGDASSFVIYIDGVVVDSSARTGSGTFGTSLYPVTIGGYVWDEINNSSSYSFDGFMRKVGFWNVALSQAQIQNRVTGNLDYTGAESGLIAGYNFYEGTGASVTPVGNYTSAGLLGNDTQWQNYTYSWSNGAGTFAATTKDLSGLFAEDYSVSITTDLGCPITWSYTINEPAVISLTFTADHPDDVCVGEVVVFNASATGGTGALSYEYFEESVSLGSNTSYTRTLTSANNDFRVVVSDENSCTTEESKSFIVHGIPTTGIIRRD